MNYKLPLKVDLNDKVAIITGGSGTLCHAMAWGLGKCGAKVVLIGRNESKMAIKVNELKQDGIAAYGYCCDVTDKNSLEEVYSKIKIEVGSCDILINGAGGNKPSAITKDEMLKAEFAETDYSFWDLEESGIRDVMDVNYLGTLLPTQIFTRDMVAKRSGSVINIASVSSFTSLTKVMAYSNAKGAILNFTRWLAVHLGESGIRCNAIAPGFYDAEQNHDLLFNPDGSPTSRAAKILAGTPMNRFGDPQDLIGAALFLASEEASKFVNGIVIQVDGGFTAYNGV